MRLQAVEQTPITFPQGLRLQKDIAADAYLECSAVTRKNLQSVFDEAIRVVMLPVRPVKRARHKCSML